MSSCSCNPSSFNFILRKTPRGEIQHRWRWDVYLATGALADVSMVQSCIDSAFRLFPPSPENPDVLEPSGDDELQLPQPEPIDVLVDVIIGCLEKGTAFMRAVGNRSFSLLSGMVNYSTIDLILSVSVPKKEFFSIFIKIYSNWNVGNLGNFLLTRGKKVIRVMLDIQKPAAMMTSCPLLGSRTVQVTRQTMRDSGTISQKPPR